MELSEQDVRDRVDDTEDKRTEYYALAEEWENIWMLRAFDETWEAAFKKGREQITFPDPVNVMNLTMRLLSNTPSIEVPTEQVTDQKDEAADRRKKFLSGLWHRSNKEGRENVLKSGAFMGGVRGRFVFDIRWIRDQLPQRLKNRRMPIHLRSLDPLSCGFRRGPYGPLWCYHKYTDEKLSILQQWPDIDIESVDAAREKRGRTQFDEYEVVDFWYVDSSSGRIWNTVLVEDSFAKAPMETLYPDLPMVEGRCDATPLENEAYRGLSLMHAMGDMWKYKCKLASQIGTGMLWYFWPMFLISNEYGHPVPDFEVTPGVTQNVPWGTKADIVSPNPNVPLAQALMQLAEQSIQQSTFPGVMYGEAPGQIQAGYGVSLLSDAAKGRINSLREELEWAASTVNEIALGLVEAFADDEGVSVWGKDEGVDGLVHIKITPQDVAGFYENLVRITPNLPDDDIQTQTMGLRLVQEGVMSRRTLRARTRYAGLNLPDDEENRVMVEQILLSDEVRKMGMESQMQRYFGDNWRQIVGMPEQQPQMGQPQQPMGGPPPNGMPPQQNPQQGTMPMPGGMPGMPQLPPEAQGMQTPEMAGLPPNVPPELWQAMQGGAPGPIDDEMMRRMQGGA